MNETLLTSIDQVLDVRAESQFEIYCSIGDQLVKEFFVEQAYMESGGTPPPAKKNKDGEPFNEDGRIPKFTKIADWFARFITKLRSWFIRKNIEQLLKKITDLPIYKEHDNDPEFEFQCIFPEKAGNWLGKKGDKTNDTYIGISKNLNLKEWELYLTDDTKLLMTRLVTKLDIGKLQDIVKSANKLRIDAKDLLDDVKKVTAINTSSAKVIKLKQREVDFWLRMLKDANEVLKDRIDKAFNSIKSVKEVCNYIISKSKIDTQQKYEKISEQYVKFITDYTQALLSIAQCEAHITGRIYYSLGHVKSERLNEKV